MSETDLPRLLCIPDSPDTRLLLELTSHATDLSEAAHALGSARDVGEDSHLWMPLTMHAATAYVRPFIDSKVRRRLDTMDEFPGFSTELADVHATIRQYRNTTVAHSQSELATPLAVAVLTDRGTLRTVMGTSIMHPMTGVVAERFRALIAAAAQITQEMTAPVIQRLEQRLRPTPPKEIATWPVPEGVDKTADQFNGARARSHEPRTTIFWSVETELLAPAAAESSGPPSARG